MNTRGSGYTDFAYTCLTLGNLLVALLFFIGPARAMRISLMVVTVLLIADMIVIAAVTRLRIEEGWVGLFSVIWASVMSIWCIVTDRTVEWGKREEEERLTGRPEKRRTLSQWLSVLAGTFILIIYILVAILLTVTLVMRAIDATLQPDGQRIFVDGDKYQVHLNCIGNVTDTQGNKAVTVLLESGEDPVEYELTRWAYHTYTNGTIPRFCYWDRPGYAWSDNAPSPHSAGMSAVALTEALAVAGETGPWISLSAGYGSVVARIFAAMNLRDVAGIMLIDPLHEDLLDKYAASPAQGFKLWAFGVLSPLGIQRLGGALFKGRTKEDRVYGPSADETGTFLKAKLQENLVASSLSKSELKSARNIQDERTPLVVVSSGLSIRKDASGEWERKQRDLTGVTGNLMNWDVVKRAEHRVWRSLEGRDIMEKRVGQLVRKVEKGKKY